MELAALKQAAQEASPGPWKWDGRKVDDEGYVYIPECSYIVGGIALAYQHEGYQRDCDFIALANPQAVLELIASHEALLAALRKTQALLFMRTNAKDDEAMAALQQSRAVIKLATGAPA